MRQILTHPSSSRSGLTSTWSCGPTLSGWGWCRPGPWWWRALAARRSAGLRPPAWCPGSRQELPAAAPGNRESTSPEVCLNTTEPFASQPSFHQNCVWFSNNHSKVLQLSPGLEMSRILRLTVLAALLEGSTAEEKKTAFETVLN